MSGLCTSPDGYLENNDYLLMDTINKLFVYYKYFLYYRDFIVT